MSERTQRGCEPNPASRDACMMWTLTTTAIPAESDPTRSIKTSALHSDDGALLIYQGANRERVQFFDYQRGELCIRLSGSEYDGMLEPTGIFTVYLSVELAFFRRRHPGQSEPTDAEIEVLKTDLSEALPSWGSALWFDTITAVDFA